MLWVRNWKEDLQTSICGDLYLWFMNNSNGFLFIYSIYGKGKNKLHAKAMVR